jgi:hypothetical protein
MYQHWHCTLRVTQHRTQLLVSQPERDLLKARLDTTPQHPRALLTLLEGLSLWSGKPLCVALSVDDNCPHWQSSQLFGDEFWPVDSPLVQYDVVPRVRRRQKLSGLGDFRQLRLALRRGTP